MVNLRGFPNILVNCLGWCHIMIPVLDVFLAAVVFLKDHSLRIIRFKPDLFFLLERIQVGVFQGRDYT